ISGYRNCDFEPTFNSNCGWNIPCNEEL
ncbi:hypothetical protein CARUB_v100165483mg, partial [Capsella rubella]